jgi:hypothetical protein
MVEVRRGIAFSEPQKTAYGGIPQPYLFILVAEPFFTTTSLTLVNPRSIDLP